MLSFLDLKFEEYDEAVMATIDMKGYRIFVGINDVHPDTWTIEVCEKRKDNSKYEWECVKMKAFNGEESFESSSLREIDQKLIEAQKEIEEYEK